VLFGSVFGILAMVAGLLWLFHRRTPWTRGAGLSDAMISRIERTGRLNVEEEEPLDLKEIHEEEKRFWEEEPWDEPEEL
jgi:hypothetical protein